MKKTLYVFLAVSFIFSACEKEEDTPTLNGCTESTAINYNSNATVDDGSCTYDLVGKWTFINTVIDSTFTVSYMGETIDSLSSSGSRIVAPWYGPLSLEFMSNGTVWDGEDTLGYTTNGNILIVEDIGSLHYAIVNSDLSLVGGEEDSWQEAIVLENGSVLMVDVYFIWTNTLNFTRNTSGIVNTNATQRVGNNNHNWLTKPKLNNSIKKIK